MEAKMHRYNLFAWKGITLFAPKRTKKDEGWWKWMWLSLLIFLLPLVLILAVFKISLRATLTHTTWNGSPVFFTQQFLGTSSALILENCLENTELLSASTTIRLTILFSYPYKQSNKGKFVMLLLFIKGVKNKRGRKKQQVWVQRGARRVVSSTLLQHCTAQQPNRAPSSSQWHLAQNKQQLYKICVYFLYGSFDLNICLREFPRESKTVFAVKVGRPHVAVYLILHSSCIPGTHKVNENLRCRVNTGPGT